jgi:hypothetical protein
MVGSAHAASIPACGGRAGSVDTADYRGRMHVGNGRAGFARWRSCARRSRPLSRGGDGKRSKSRWSCCSSQRWWRPNRRRASQLFHDAHGRTAVRANESRRGSRGRGLPRRGCRNGERHLQQLTRSSQVLPAAGVGEQAVGAYAVEAAGMKGRTRTRRAAGITVATVLAPRARQSAEYAYVEAARPRPHNPRYRARRSPAAGSIATGIARPLSIRRSGLRAHQAGRRRCQSTRCESGVGQT